VPSHRLLVRAGYVRRVGPGIYSWLPLGMEVLRNIEGVVREEMVAIGGQEVHFPALIPREIFEASGRWADYGDALFRLADRKRVEYLLGPTHEELFTLLVDLPPPLRTSRRRLFATSPPGEKRKPKPPHAERSRRRIRFTRAGADKSAAAAFVAMLGCAEVNPQGRTELRSKATNAATC
jgi:hypothetical protein